MAYNSVVTGCARAGEWQRALAVLRQMYMYGAEPDVVTYNAAMAACAEVSFANSRSKGSCSSAV